MSHDGSPSPIRVAHVGLGTIGRTMVQVAVRRSDMESVCFVDSSDALVGRDAGDVTGMPQLGGLQVQKSVSDEALSDVDVVLHSTSSSLPVVASQLQECLEAGCHVVSTCEELAYPFAAYPKLAVELDSRARAAGVVLIGTGVNPGFVMDALPALLSTTASEVELAEVTRVVDTARRRPQLRSKTGASLTVQEFEALVTSGQVGHVGLVQSAQLLAGAFRWEIEQLQETIAPVVSPLPVILEGVRIEAGCVLGITQRVSVTAEGRVRIVLELHMSVGAPDPRDEITLHGPTTTHALIAGGVEGDTATAAIAVSTAARLAAASPGLRTVLDLPISAGLRMPAESPRRHPIR